MDDQTAEATLKTIATSLNLLAAVVIGRNEADEPVVMIAANDENGQTYRVSAPTYSEAVVAFAEVVGFELEDG